MTIDHSKPAQQSVRPLTTSRLPLDAWLRKDVLILLAIFAVFYWTKLAGFSLSIDDEFAALSTNADVWVLDGRWCEYLFERFIVSQPIVPFFPVFLFGLCMSISYTILLAAFGIKRMSFVHYLVFPLYVAFPTWTFLASFTANISSAGVAQLAVVGALYCYRDACIDPASGSSPVNRSSTVKRCAFAILLLGCAIGLYQSFLLAFVVLGLGMQMSLFNGQMLSTRISVRLFFWLAAITVGGFGLYAILDAAFRHGLHLEDTTYLNAFMDWHLLLRSPVAVIRHTTEFMGEIYLGHPLIYGIAAFAFPVILATGGTAIVLSGNASRRHRLVLLITSLSILAIPFAQNLLVGGYMPIRTMVAIPCIFWLFALYGLTASSRALAIVTLAAVLLGLLQIIYSTSLLGAAQTFARIHDAQLSSALYQRITQVHENFDPSKTYLVDFYGAEPFGTTYPRPYSSTSGFSFFEWDGGNEGRMLAYMRLLGYTDLQPANAAQRQQDLA
ncbi:MAG: glucosyltransferase domain-containing protein, partial [Xanthomonadaceae bacterium]|nr:glucosyltransferase domain-containing protein [Xanthomonadaceae bacterium]